MSQKIGRNDPCPCGSGKKYKQCCLLKTDSLSTGTVIDASDRFAGLRRELGEQVFDTMDEVQAFMDSHSERQNRAPLEDFQGLSPEQMYRMLHFPFDSPELFTFAGELAGIPEVPVLRLFSLLVEALGEKGLKCTAKGNLPRAFCQQAAVAWHDAASYEDLHRLDRVNTEEDFMELHVTRIVSKQAGLIRKYRGRFLLTREGERLLDGPGMAAIYPRLLRAFVQKFNWAYNDGYPELPFIQQSFLFTLYLLQRYGGEERPQTWYEDAFIGAFPQLLEEAVPRPYSTPEDQIRRCYTLRMLERFASFLGLVTLENVADERWKKDYMVTKNPLLDEVVEFHLRGSEPSAPGLH